MGGPNKTPEFTYKNCVYSYMIKFQSPSEYSPLHAIYLSRRFCRVQSSFWICWFWSLLVFLPFFVSPFPQQQNVSLWGLFSSEETKKSHSGPDGVNRGMGHKGHVIFSQKLLNTQQSVGKCVHKPSIMRWPNMLKESSKKFTEVKQSLSQQCQLGTDAMGS